MPELPNIVRERLKVSRPMAAHPDADVLTAFAERALPESERAVVAEHLARCHDCRDILALALPATVTADSARVLPVRGDWFGAPVLRWGVVAAGLAVLAVTGLLQYQRRHVMQTSVAARQTNAVALEETTARAGRAEESANPALGVPSVVAESASGASAKAKRLPAASANGNANAGSTNDRAVAVPMNKKATPSDSLASNGRQLIAGLPLHGAGSGSAARISSSGGPSKQTTLYGQTAPSSTSEMQSQLVAGNTADQASNQPSQYQGNDQKKDQEHAAVAGGRPLMDATVDKAKAPQTITVEVSAAAPMLETSSAAPAAPSAPVALRWAISPAGGLLRSFDQGRTWASVDVNASFPVASQMVMVVPQAQRNQQPAQQAAQQAAQLTAPNQTQGQAQAQAQAKTLGKSQGGSQQRGAASAVSVPVFRALSAAGLEIWAGGSAGVLYHSANGGEQWTRVVPSASGILLTGDIIGIAFSDHQHGQITTSTQELWTTIDGGQTWQKQ